MVVKRGEEWGEEVSTPLPDAVVVTSDAAVASAVGGSEGRPVVVRGGDLHRSLGAPSGTAPTRRVPIDLIAVAVDGRRLTAVAHVVVRRRGRLGWWRGSVFAVLNVDHVGSWDAAPRAHPNDGWLDVVEVAQSMSVRTRWQAWQRVRTGDHVPHPDITTRRIRSEALSFDGQVGVWVDGVDCGTVATLDVEIVPDAAEIYV